MSNPVRGMIVLAIVVAAGALFLWRPSSRPDTGRVTVIPGTRASPVATTPSEDSARPAITIDPLAGSPVLRRKLESQPRDRAWSGATEERLVDAYASTTSVPVVACGNTTCSISGALPKSSSQDAVRLMMAKVQATTSRLTDHETGFQRGATASFSTSASDPRTILFTVYLERATGRSAGAR